MNDYWNDPPEEYEPECCEEPMDISDGRISPDGVCSCSKCGKRIEPEVDGPPEPDIELPDDYLREK